MHQTGTIILRMMLWVCINVSHANIPDYGVTAAADKIRYLPSHYFSHVFSKALCSPNQDHYIGNFTKHSFSPKKLYISNIQDRQRKHLYHPLVRRLFSLLALAGRFGPWGVPNSPFPIQTQSLNCKQIGREANRTKSWCLLKGIWRGTPGSGPQHSSLVPPPCSKRSTDSWLLPSKLSPHHLFLLFSLHFWGPSESLPYQ